MTLRHAWVLPLTPTVVVLLIAVALVPITSTDQESAWLLGLLATALTLAALVALAATRLSGEPTRRPWTIAAATGILTVLTPFAINALLGGPLNAVLVVPWLIFGLGAAYWQLSLCEGARSRSLHAAIGFSYTFVFTAVTLFLAALVADLVH